MRRLLLYIRVRKFYKIFGSMLGSDFINRLSDMTYDNLHDVLFDINEVRDHDTVWLNKLYTSIEKFKFTSSPSLK